jgi:hypothetical protein
MSHWSHPVMVGAMLCIASVLCAGGAAAEDEMCGGSYTARSGQHSEGYIYVRAGKPCKMIRMALGASRASAGIAIVTRPRNGSASASGTGIRYAPRAGFKGTDKMTVRFSWNGPPSNKLTSGSVTFTVIVE